MAKASKKHFGAGAQGPHSGGGAMTDLPDDMLGENMVTLQPRQARHSKERGADGKEIATEQRQDHAANRIPKKDRRRSR